MVEVWGSLFEDNLLAFITIVGDLFAGERVTDDDLIAIKYGIKGTDVEEELWFDYELEGSSRVTFSLAFEPGSSLIVVKLGVDELIKDRAEMVLDILRDYSVVDNYMSSLYREL